MTERKKYHCRNCGQEITKDEYISNDGLCDMCNWDEEDSDLFIGGGW
jgi:DNA-directed RNA polymerase subunit RPC12/RpoP